MAASRHLPLATLALAAIAVAAYLGELGAGGMAVCEALGFTATQPSLGTVLTSIWLHDPEHAGHLVGNVVVLAILGAVVEPALGGRGVIALFMASGLGGALLHLVVSPGSETPLVGMSASVCGLMAAAAVIGPRAMLAAAVSYIAMNMAALFVETPLVPPGVNVACHIGGFATGTLCMVAARLRGNQPAAA